MSKLLERCCQCDDPTGKAGAAEDSLYAAGGTPAEVGPLCETCYETLTNEATLTVANDRIRELQIAFQGATNIAIELRGELTAEHEVSDKLVAALKSYVDDSREVDVGGGDVVIATCESRYLATTTIAEVSAMRENNDR